MSKEGLPVHDKVYPSTKAISVNKKARIRRIGLVHAYHLAGRRFGLDQMIRPRALTVKSEEAREAFDRFFELFFMR